MNRNTITTLGQLRKGDRYCSPGKTEVWQVIDFINKEKVAVNQFDQAGKRIHKYDVIKKSALPVKFLRHTIFEMGEQCFVEQLEEGDVFTLLDNVVIEYKVREQYNDQSGKECKAVKLDGSKDIAFIKHGTEVIFIRK